MGRSVRLDDDLYERIEADRRDDETVSEAIERLIDDYSLLDFSDEFDDEPRDRWATHEAALNAIEAAERGEE